MVAKKKGDVVAALAAENERLEKKLKIEKELKGKIEDIRKGADKIQRDQQAAAKSNMRMSEKWLKMLGEMSKTMDNTINKMEAVHIERSRTRIETLKQRQK